MHRTYLFVGISESGISTAANCLFNKKAELKYLNDPFQTLGSDSANNKIYDILKNPNNDDLIIDIKGFDENSINNYYFLDKSVRKDLAEHSIQSIDLIIFVFRCGKFTNEYLNILRKLKSDFSDLGENFLLLISNSPKDWINKENQKNNEYLQEALRICAMRYIEFKLDYEDDEDDEDCKKAFFHKREKQIHEFVNAINLNIVLNLSRSLKVSIENEDDDTTEPKVKRIKSENESSNDDIINLDDIKQEEVEKVDLIKAKQVNFNIILGHYLDETERKDFDNKLIDLTILRDHLRNEKTALIIARAWYIARKYILNDSEFTQSKFNTETTLYENVFAGDEQSMKTPIQLIIQYFITLAFGIVGVMVVRNNGGKDHIDKCKNYKFSAVLDGKKYSDKLNELLKLVLQNKYSDEWNDLFEDQKNIFDIEMLDFYSKRLTDDKYKHYGKLTKLFMVIGLYNKAFIDKIAKMLVPEDKNYVECFKNKDLFRFGLIIDEEDELLVSVDRDNGVTERSMFKTPRSILNNLPVRFAASFIFSTSATFFNMIYNDIIIDAVFKEGDIKKELKNNVMVKSIPHNYHGFSCFIEKEENRIKIKSISPTEDIGLVTNNYFERLDFLDSINKKCLQIFFKKKLPERYKIKKATQLSVLISLGAIWINENQDLLAKTILMVLNNNFPTICFSYNQKNEIQMFTNQFMGFNFLKNIVSEKFKIFVDKTNIKIDYLENIQSIKIILPKTTYLKDYYDIANEMCSGFKSKPIIICCAGRLSNRCLTFKGETFNYPLTDQYYCPTILKSGKITSTFNLDAKQIFSRIAGVDNFKFERVLWIPSMIEKEVDDSIKIYDELKDLHSNYKGEDWRTCLSEYLEKKHETLYKCIIKEANITKNSIMKKLKTPLVYHAKKNTNLEESPEDPLSKEEDTEEENFDFDQSEDENDDLSEESDDEDFENKNVAFIYMLFKEKLKDKKYTKEKVFDYLEKNNLIRRSDEKRKRKKCFVYPKSNHKEDKMAKRDALFDAIKDYKHTEDNGDILYYYDD